MMAIHGFVLQLAGGTPIVYDNDLVVRLDGGWMPCGFWVERYVRHPVYGGSPRESNVAVEKLTETRDHYEKFPFIEGGSERIAWWQEYLKPFLPDSALQGRLIGDIGSSVGEISRGLGNRGARTVCLDVTLAALRRCLEINPNSDAFHGDALNLPFADETFDHTVCIGVLMITSDCRRGLQEVARVTAAGGTVVLFIYNYWSYLNLVYHLFKPVRKILSLEDVPRPLVRMMGFFARRHLGMDLDDAQLRRLLGDKLWTPQATFHTVNQIRKWGEAEGLVLRRWKRFYHHYANVMAFQKSGVLRDNSMQGVEVRCLDCGDSPLPRFEEGYHCGNCGKVYEKKENIHRFLCHGLPAEH